MGIDFKVLKRIVKEAIDKLDHRDLNTLPWFQDQNPSSEHIAAFLFDELRPRLASDTYALYSVTVLETDTQGLTYYGGLRPQEG